MNPYTSCSKAHATQGWVCPCGLPRKRALRSLEEQLALVETWLTSPNSGLGVFRDTPGDSGSLAELSDSSTGLVPGKAIVSTVHAHSALRLHRNKEDGCMWQEFHFPHLPGSGISGAVLSPHSESLNGRVAFLSYGIEQG